MINISLPDALKLWSELEAAYYGDNKFGGTVAEIYAYTVKPLSFLAHGAYESQDLSGLPGAALRAEAKENGQTLYELLKLFQRTHRCSIEVDGMSPKKALLHPNRLFVHRCHVAISTGDKIVRRMRQAARGGRV